jgi:hypothetical protein
VRVVTGVACHDKCFAPLAKNNSVADFVCAAPAVQGRLPLPKRSASSAGSRGWRELPAHLPRPRYADWQGKWNSWHVHI